MPFQSQAQRGFLYANHPDIAKKFEAETPKGVKLPEHVSEPAMPHQRLKTEIMKRLMPKMKG